jgi:glucose/arabinose dehydrogenase
VAAARRRCFGPTAERLECRLALATLPPNFSEIVVASGLSSATAMELAPDGKLFVAEQGGTMEVWGNGTRLEANFFRDAPIATQTVSERGLLGVAFDPAYATNRFVYVYYTTTAPDHHNRVSRFTANASGDLAMAGSETILVDLDAHSAGNHNGGAIHFGPDGKLYVAVGDNAQGANAQLLTNRHGKMLRYNADGTIPADNPTTFAGISGSTSGANRAIWAVGLRNPFTFSFEPGTGRMHINDVGQNTWEEINVGAAGANYGWPTTEGDFNQGSFPDFTRPLYAYSHGSGTFQGFAITGGAFYRASSPGPNRFPAEFDGDYFFADVVNDWINVIDTGTLAVTRFGTGAGGPVDVRVDADGSLYYLARNAGMVFRAGYFANEPPSISPLQNQQASVGGSATFAVLVTGSTPLAYQWQRAEQGTSQWVDIPGATSPTYTLTNAQLSDSGDQFRVRVSNAVGNQTSNAAVLTVTENQPPSASISIDAGLTGGRFIAGQGIAFSGGASDAEDGALGASRFAWRVDYITSTASGNPVVRPFLPEFQGQTSGSFTPATNGPYTLTDVDYRVVLTVTDSNGLSTTLTSDIEPNTATLSLTTSPAGLQVTLDGQPFVAPIAFESVVGFERAIGTPGSHSVGGVTYAYVSWSDGGPATHTVTTPPLDTTYTASFAPAVNPGLKAEFFDFRRRLSRLPDLRNRLADVTRTDLAIDYDDSTGLPWAGLDGRFSDTFAVRHTGFLRIDTPGDYTLFLSSGDGSKLWIDGKLLVNNNGLHGPREVSGTRRLSAGLHTIRVEFFEDTGEAELRLSWTGPGIGKEVIPGGQFVAGAFRQRRGATGIVAVEAENRDANVGQGGKVWMPRRAAAGRSGLGVMQALADTGVNQDTGYLANSPRLDFRVNFARAGVHYVWVRGRATRGGGGSVHVGLDGNVVESADRIGPFSGRGLGWVRATLDGPVAAILVASPGLHTLNLWMREDGTIIDKVVLSTRPNFRPRGIGPAESRRL